MTTYTTKAKDIKRNWHLIDLGGKILGREAAKIAQLLIGKNKTYYSPNMDCGDYVVAVNTDKIRLTGKKEQQKIYQSHSGYPGGFKELSFKQMMKKDSRKVIEMAVKNMLPKNKLRQARQRRLKLFKDENHKYGEKINGKRN